MHTCPLAQLVYLLATVAAFDVSERRRDCAMSGEKKGTDEMDQQRMVGGLLHLHQEYNLVKCLHTSDMFLCADDIF